MGRRVSPLAGGILRLRLLVGRSLTNTLLFLVLLGFLFQYLGGLIIGAVLFGNAWLGVEELTRLLAVGSGEPGILTSLLRGAPISAGVVTDGVLLKPWSPVTSLFLHGGLFHLFFNCLFLYFFGPHVEIRIGRRQALKLFVGAGMLAGIVQALVFGGYTVGASGAIMGSLGMLTVLVPRMQVIFWFVPMPLFAMTLIFVTLDLLGTSTSVVRGVGSGIANVAHLAGLAIGLVYGMQLRSRGVFIRDRASLLRRY